VTDLRAVVARLLGRRELERQLSEPDYPRSLTAEERDALNFLLSADFPGVEELREQAKVVSVVGRRCGCASVDFSVDTEVAQRTKSYEPVPVEAHSRDVGPGGPFQLLLFVREGWLAGLEIVYFANELPVEFPPLDAFEPPLTFPLA